MSLVITTIDTIEAAEKVADQIIRERLAASVHYSPVRSIYWWKGEIYREKEYELVFRTTRNQHNDLQKRIKELHPYELPEILIIDTSGSSETAGWIKDSTNTDPPKKE